MWLPNLCHGFLIENFGYFLLCNCLFLLVGLVSVFIAHILLVSCRIGTIHNFFYCFFCWEENYMYLSFENNWLTTTRCLLVPHFPSPKLRDLASLYIMGLTISLTTHQLTCLRAFVIPLAFSWCSVVMYKIHVSPLCKNLSFQNKWFHDHFLFGWGVCLGQT